MKKTVNALLLNAFVLPGMGQIYLGYKGKGIAIIVLTNLLMLVAFLLIIKITGPVVGAHLTGMPITAAMIMEQIKPFALWIKLLLAAIFTLWCYSLIDLATSFKRTDGSIS